MGRLSFVYILSNKRNGTLYTGVTSDLPARIYQHKKHVVEGFTQKYKITRLVWFECCEGMRNAIEREKQIKGWVREKKIALIEKINPEWHDLFEEIVG